MGIWDGDALTFSVFIGGQREEYPVCAWKGKHVNSLVEYGNTRNVKRTPGVEENVNCT